MRLTHPTDKANFSCLEIGHLTIWFSYETPIALFEGGRGMSVRKNDWGPTTGKHINAIQSDKTGRVAGFEFEKRLEQAMYRLTGEKI